MSITSKRRNYQSISLYRVTIALIGVVLIMPCKGWKAESLQVKKDIGIKLYPIYVGAGSSSVLKNGCSLSIFDAGGKDKNGFKRLEETYKQNQYNDNKKIVIDKIIVSHAHKDHIEYLNKMADNHVTIEELIGNNSVKKSRTKWGIDRLKITGREIYHSIDINKYQVKTFDLNDKQKCNKREVKLELLWGSVKKEDIKNNKKYLKKKENNDSVVSGIYGDIIPVLFLGDANKPGQNLLMNLSKKNLTKYKGGIIYAAHHGQQNGLYEPLYKLLKPSKIVISRSNQMIPKKTLQKMNKHIKGGELVEREVFCKNKKTGHRCIIKISSDIIILNPEDPTVLNLER